MNSVSLKNLPSSPVASRVLHALEHLAQSKGCVMICAVIAVFSTVILVWKAAPVLPVYACFLMLPIIVLIGLIHQLHRVRFAEAKRHSLEMEQLHLETIDALATAIDARDEITHEHVRRVRIYARGLARIFNLSEAEIEALHAGALLHDIGKLGVPDHILNKPGLLTPGEFEKMKMHTLVGAEILSRVNFPYPVVPIVRSHHERWDGNGYPDGLRGEQIPMTARILSVVDCFDAVRENRPYRRGLTRDEAVAMLQKGRGGQFDPRVVDTFIENLSKFESELKAARAGYDEQSAERINWHDPATREQMLRGNTAKPNAGYAIEPAGPTPSVIEKIKAAQIEGTVLYEIARSLTSTQEMSLVVAQLHEQLQRLIPFDTCVIFVNEPGELFATARFVTGWNAEWMTGRRIEYGLGISGFVLAQRRVFANTDPLLDFSAAEMETREPYCNILACPLVRGEETVGVLTFYSRSAERYIPDHLRLAETVAATVAETVYQDQRHSRNSWLEETVVTDPLTGLPNARSLEMNFAGEVQRAIKAGASLTLLSFDIDDFKSFNEQHGHSTGDDLLRDLAGLLTEETQHEKQLVRYAADQFVTVLHQQSPRHLEELTERINQRVSNWKFCTGSDQQITISLTYGYATYNADGNSLAAMMRVADERLREAKAARHQPLLHNNLRYFPGVRRTQSL